MSEHEIYRHPDDSTGSAPLPSELAEFLRQQGPYACLTHATDRGTAYIIKTPSKEIRRLHGAVPIAVSHELYYQLTSSVIRTLLIIYDDPENPILLESFINVGDDNQRRDFAALATQDELLLLFYGDDLSLQLGKRVRNTAQDTLPELLRRAEAFLATIPPGRVDFDQAKADVMEPRL